MCLFFKKEIKYFSCNDPLKKNISINITCGKMVIEQYYKWNIFDVKYEG